VKSYKVSACCNDAKHCNFITKIDSPPSAYGETLQKFLQQLAVVLSLKVWEQIFENDYYGFKKQSPTSVEPKLIQNMWISHSLDQKCYTKSQNQYF